MSDFVSPPDTHPAVPLTPPPPVPQVPDWRFPFKRSHHPVCIHDEVRLRSITLEHCDPGVADGTADYRYLDAVSCKCDGCDSALASCEGAKFRSTRSWRPMP